MLKKFLDEFKAFALKGNVMDLAIGVIIGGAFSSIVTSLLDNVISPIVGCFSYGGIRGVSVQIWKANLYIGAFLNDCVNFIIMALVVFFMMKFVNKLIGKKKEEPAPAEPSKEEKLLAEIRDLLTATASDEALAKLEAAKAEAEAEDKPAE